MDGAHGHKAQDPGAGTVFPKNTHAVPGVDVRRASPAVGNGVCQGGPLCRVRMLQIGKFQEAGPDDLLVLGLPQIQAVTVDEVLHHRVDEIGDVPPVVDVFPDAGGGDVLQMGGKPQLQDLALNTGEVGVQLLAGGVAGAAKDDMVEVVDGPVPGRYLVGGCVGNHIGSHREIQFPSGKDLPQPVQV